MSNSVWPQRQKPTRHPRPWDSPGKNTGVGCHFLLQCMKVKSEREVSRSVVSDFQRPHGVQPTRLLRPWDFPGRSTGVGATGKIRQLLQQVSQVLHWFAGLFFRVPQEVGSICLLKLQLSLLLLLTGYVASKWQTKRLRF